MPWYRLENDYYEHPKIVNAGPLAELLFVRSIAYAHKHQTDGFVPRSIAYRLAGDIAGRYNEQPGNLVAGLVQSSLWIPREGEGVLDGWDIHDYLEYQESKQEIEDRRAKTRDRVTRFRERSRNDVTPPVSNAVTPPSNDVTNADVTTLHGGGSGNVSTSTRVIDVTTTTTKGNAVTNGGVTRYSYDHPCLYESQIVPQFFANQASKLDRVSQHEMGEEWLRQRLREVFEVQGPLDDDTVRTRFSAAMRQVIANATAYHEGTLKKNLRTSLPNYARGTFVRTMQGEERR